MLKFTEGSKIMKGCILKVSILVFFMLAASDCASAFAGFRGATWGELRYDLPKEGEENLVLDGWIKQGVDWARWGNTSLNTYVTIRYKWDSERLDWNNSIGPGVGISLDTYSAKGFVASLGAEYIWENRLHDTGPTDQRAFVYFSWVGWWDLKQK